MSNSLHLLWEHLGPAGIAALVFFVGLGSAWIVVRYRLDFLARFPLWLLGKVSSLFNRHPHVGFMFLFIFLFNGTVMFFYMLSGVVVGLPAAIDFLIGMNIGIVGLRGEEWSFGGGERRIAATPGARDGLGKKSGYLLAACFITVACIELPCLWFSIAMGNSIMSLHTDVGISQLWQESVIPRMVAYATIILPLLAVSALAEAIGLKVALSSPAPAPRDS